MKKRQIVFSILLVGVAVCLGLLFTGCTDAGTGVGKTAGQATGKVVINLTYNTARTLLPDIDMAIASYDIYATDTSGNHVEFWEYTDTSIKLDALACGKWTFHADGKNKANTVIGTAARTVMVVNDQTTNVNLIVVPLSGTGTLDLKVNWKQEDVSLPELTVQLLANYPDPNPLNLDCDIRGGQGTFTGIYSAGYYYLYIQLRDNGRLIYGYVDAIRIVEGGTTSGTYDFTNIIFPGGNVDVQITSEMNDPLDVTINNSFMEMKPEDTVSVSASVTEAAGPVNYAWHLNGETKMIGKTYTLDGLPCGVYNISVTAITVDGKRAGQANFNFCVTGQSSGASLHLMQGSRSIAYKSTFDFDTIPAVERDKPIVFTIVNSGTADLVLTGSHMVYSSTVDEYYSVDISKTSNIIPPGQSTTFSIYFRGDITNGHVINAQISILNSISTVNPFIFYIRCTDRITGSMSFNQVGTNFNIAGNFTGYATITLIGSGGGGGGGAGTIYNRDTLPIYIAPGPDGSKGLSGEKITETIPMMHGVIYNLRIGRGGYLGSGNYVNGNGYNGSPGEATTLTVNGEPLLEAKGGLGGNGGGIPDILPSDDLLTNHDGAEGGIGGKGGDGYTTSEIVGIPPDTTTVIRYHWESGKNGTTGQNGSATISWWGFAIP